MSTFWTKRPPNRLYVRNESIDCWAPNKYSFTRAAPTFAELSLCSSFDNPTNRVSLNFGPEVMQRSTNGWNGTRPEWINVQGASRAAASSLRLSSPRTFVCYWCRSFPITLKCWFCSSKKSDFSLKTAVLNVFIKIAAESVFLLFRLVLCSAASFDRAEVIQTSAGATGPGPAPARKKVWR